MPTIYERSASRFFTKESVATPKLLTIKGWHEDQVGNPPEPRDVLDFVEVEKGLVLNDTKKKDIAAALEIIEMNDWAGHRIVLEQDLTIKMGNRTVGGIKCRAPRVPTAIAPVPTRPPTPRPPVPKPVPPPPVEPVGELPPGVSAEDDEVPF